MPRPIQLPKRPTTPPLSDRLTTAVHNPWWHPAAYLLIAALIITGDVADQWWLGFLATSVALFSAVGWGFSVWAAPLIEQDRRRRAAVNTALGEIAGAAGDLAAVAHGIAFALRAVADAGTAVQDAMRVTHPSSDTTDKPDA